MMRVLFLFCLSFCFLKADAQLPWNYPGAGIRMKKMISDSVAQIPSDTTNNKTGIARIGSTVYVGNGVKWTASGGSSDTNFVRPQRLADSAAAIRSALIDTAANIRGDFPTYTGVTQQQLDDTSAAIRGAIPSQHNQLLFGGEITGVSHLQFFITSAQYRIGGRTFTSPDTTITLAAAGDSNRIDVFVVDTLNRVVSIQGTQSSNPVPPSVDPIKELLLNFVFVGTDTVYFTPTPVNYWSALGNDIINNNTGKVQFTNGLYMDQITANDSRLFTARQLVLQSNRSTGSKIYAGITGGNTALNTSELQLSIGDNSTTGTAKNALSLTGRSLHASGSEAINMISITPSLVQSGSYTGSVRGIYYNPTVTANVGTHYAFESTLGRIKFGGMETGDTTTFKPLGIDASGNVRKLASWPVGSGGGGGITRQELIDTANAIRSSLASFQAAMYDSLAAIRVAIPAAGVSQSALNDTAAAIRNYTTENIKYVAAGDGVVMTVTGDTARFSVDTAYIQRLVMPYKIYTALITQSGTDAPVATVLQNTTGATISYEYVATGSYTINASSPIFISNKVIAHIQTWGDDNISQRCSIISRASNSMYAIYQTDCSDTAADKIGDGSVFTTFIEIKIYN